MTGAAASVVSRLAISLSSSWRSRRIAVSMPGSRSACGAAGDGAAGDWAGVTPRAVSTTAATTRALRGMGSPFTGDERALSRLILDNPSITVNKLPRFPAGTGMLHSGAVDDVAALVDRIWRSDAAGMLGALSRRLGDFDRAEEALSDALAEALKRWPGEGVPDSPAGWLVTTGWRKALD